MKLDEFAQHLLFGKNLSQKLLNPPSNIDYLSKSGAKLPNSYFVPGRDYTIDFSKDREAFPSLDSLQRKSQKAKVLHYFANHELLAIEIMALILLRFPEAPISLKKAFVQSIKEEQMHFKFYVERMQALGVEFGQHTRNDFFWKVMQPICDVKQMLSHLSLTFEQANLDFSLQFQKLFFDLGDKVTARYLYQVYEDELKHVKIGLHWFNHFRPQTKSLWQEYLESLCFPITPMRAKGKFFSIEARKQVGFDDEYITKLKYYSASKGNCPNVYFFNPEVEYEVAKSLDKKRTLPQVYRNLKQDLEQMLLLVGNTNDIHIFENDVSQRLLQRLCDISIKLPEIQVGAWEQVLKKISHRKLNQLRPWGRNSVTSNFAKQLNISDEPNICWKKLYSKEFGFDLWREFAHNNTNPYMASDKFSTISSLNEVNKFVAENEANTYVLKPLVSSAGRGSIVFSKDEIYKIENRIHLALKSGKMLIEPWYEKRMDFSLQLRANSNSQLEYIGVTRFLTQFGGQYRGAILGNYLYGFKADERELILSEKKMNFNGVLEEVQSFLQNYISKIGYTGYIGVDGFIFSESSQLKVRPLLECNFRMNFGTLTQILQRKVASHKNGLFLIFSPRDFSVFSNWNNFEKFLEAYFPWQIEREKIVSGALIFSSEFERARFLSVCIVSDSIQKIVQSLLQYDFSATTREFLLNLVFDVDK